MQEEGADKSKQSQEICMKLNNFDIMYTYIHIYTYIYVTVCVSRHHKKTRTFGFAYEIMISITNVSADLTNSDVVSAADALGGERDELVANKSSNYRLYCLIMS